MATRSGGFGASLSPFGSGSLGGLSQYDIGADLADLEVYRVEVAWGNGLATDEAYIAALTQARDTSDQNTQRRDTAQNKLDDAVYRIGRSKAEASGLDQLIAFDQAALSRMKPENLRYRDVSDSLDAEFAQRRSRDYGSLIDAYNAGKTSTAALQTWVRDTLTTLDAGDPDFDNWQGVATDLAERVLDEKDAKVYQNYQQDRMTGKAFLTYLQGRRDGFAPDSPKYADWNRKLEDATENVTDRAQSEKDSAFFNRYELGKVSDTSYLKYLRDRIAGMDKGDPQISEWKHRLTQAAFSVSEDTLRFAVERGKAPVSRLTNFYKNYRSTLNPGSAEWRQITRSIDSLVGRSFGGRGGGGGSKGGSKGDSATSAIGSGPKLDGSPTTTTGVMVGGSLIKVISPKYSLTNVLGLFAIDPTAKKGAISSASKFLQLNVQTLGNAVRAGDDVWLFQDPRAPGSVVPGKNPDGSAMVGKDGKPIMVRGSAYLPASNEAYANLKSVEGSNWQSAAEYALTRKDYNDYATFARRASESYDQARAADSQAREQDWEGWYKQTSTAVDHLTQQGEYGAATELATELAQRLATEFRNPYLDDTRKGRLETFGEKLADNPLMPKVDPTTGVVVEGALNLTELRRGNTVLNPGWHHTLKSDKYGRPDYGPEFDERQDGTWEADHLTVQTMYGGKVVSGEVKRSKAPVAPRILVNTPTGRKFIDMEGSAEFTSFVDENGRTVRAYSLDGQGWISPTAGMPAPTIEINATLTERPSATGKELVDSNGEVAFTQDEGAGWAASPTYLSDNPGALDWYGVAAWKGRKSATSRLRRDEMRSEFLLDEVGKMEVGGEGQRMTYATMSPSGTLNLVPSRYEYGAPAASKRTTDERTSLLREKSAIRDARAKGQASAHPYAIDAWANVQRQLPADTPDRFDGFGVGRTVTPPPMGAKSRTPLPGLTPPLSAGAPWLIPAFGQNLPGVNAVLPPVRTSPGADARLRSKAAVTPPPVRGGYVQDRQRGNVKAKAKKPPRPLRRPPGRGALI